MTWEQKFAALQVLSDTSLRMRHPGDWYVSAKTEIKDGSVLRRSYGNGATPEKAVEDHWAIYTVLPAGNYIVINAGDEARRRAVRWNGFMWADVY